MGPLLDVQLYAVQDGCARVQFVIAPMTELDGQLNESSSLLPNLEEATVIRFLEALESESRKVPMNDSVRGV